MKLTTSELRRLTDAVVSDYSLPRADRTRVLNALAVVHSTSQFPDDHTDLGDGTTPEQIVAIAYVYYFD